MRFVNVMGIVVITTKIYAYIIAMFSYTYSQALAMETKLIVGFLIGACDLDDVEKRGW